MTNPWTKKNPFMSLWLSGANRLAGRARGQAKAATIKQQSAWTRQAVSFGTNTWLATKPKRRR